MVARHLQGRLTLADPLVSEDSLLNAEYNASSWSACIHDLAVGRLDLCLGDFWVTQERLKMVNFLPSIEMDNFFLVMPGDGEESVADIMAKPFRPFEGFTWVFIMGVLTIMGMMICIAELTQW